MPIRPTARRRYLPAVRIHHGVIGLEIDVAALRKRSVSAKSSWLCNFVHVDKVLSGEQDFSPRREQTLRYPLGHSRSVASSSLSDFVRTSLPEGIEL